MALWKHLAWGVAILTVPQAVTLGTALAGFSSPGWLGFGAGLLLLVIGVLTNVLGAERSRLRYVVLTLGSVASLGVLVPLVATKVSDAVMILAGPSPKVTLAEALKTEFPVVEVEGSTVRSELLGRTLSPRKKRPDRAEQGWDEYAVPVVGPGWEKTQPITVFRHCNANDTSPPEVTEQTCLARLGEAPVWGRVSHTDLDSALVDSTVGAVKDAKKQHGLRTPSTVLVLETNENLTGWAIQFVVIWILVVLVAHVVVIGGAVALRALGRSAPG